MVKIGDESGGKGSGTDDKIIPLSSPFFLHPSDSPSLKLTQTMFNGENYDLWADAVRNGLDAKNKLGFVEGTVKKPEGTEADNPEVVAWRQCNAMIKSWLRSVIDEKLHPSITFSGTVLEIWKELKERYSAGNAPRVHQLKSELTECRQGTRSVVDYYTHLKSIWDELANYSRVPDCTCGAGAAFAKEKEEEKVHQFIMGLNTALYDHLRSNLLMEDNLTSLSRAYALVLREERHKAVTRIREDQSKRPWQLVRWRPWKRNNDKTEEKKSLSHLIALTAKSGTIQPKIVGIGLGSLAEDAAGVEEEAVEAAVVVEARQRFDPYRKSLQPR
ncbi:uncharacterized protein LOC141648336 [Silene latifolia]|uniref:uncharacterized protein LOC141648336 n=1 Tax=Silene latifolia TaxID=37657 RepID=UPI003D77A62E